MNIISYRLILVDSTRAGKKIPDALSKTVPIWCCVMNRALQQKYSLDVSNWDSTLYTPPKSVSKQENTQIEAILDAWVASLLVSFADYTTLEESTNGGFRRPRMIYHGSTYPFVPYG